MDVKRISGQGSTCTQNLSPSSADDAPQPRIRNTEQDTEKSAESGVRHRRLSRERIKPITKKKQKNQSADRCTKIADACRHVLSSLIYAAAIGTVTYGIGWGYAALPGHPAVLYAIFFFVIVLLGYLEGLQVAILALEKIPSERIIGHSRAYQTHKLATGRGGLNVQRFLIGRQFFVVFVVFLCAQLTTYPDLPRGDIPDFLFTMVIDTGLPGALIVLAFGQLVPQLIASTHPVLFMNLPGTVYVVHLTLFFEFSGITHFSWLLVAAIRSLFKLPFYGNGGYNGIEQSTPEASSTSSLKSSVARHGSQEPLVGLDADGEGGDELSPLCFERLKGSLEVEAGLIDETKIYAAAEHGIEPFSVSKSRIVSEWLQSSRPQTLYENRQKQGVSSASSPSASAAASSYPSPADIVRHLLRQGKPVPRYLLPPHSEQHIPPHIVAFDLVRRLGLLHERLARDQRASTHRRPGETVTLV